MKKSRGGLLVGKTDIGNGKGIIVKTPEGEIRTGGGEIIINEKSSNKFCEELSAINVAGGGVAIPCEMQPTANKGKYNKGGVIGSFMKTEKDFAGNFKENKVDVLSISMPRNVRGKVTDGNWAIDYEIPSILGRTGRVSASKHFWKKEDAIKWREQVLSSANNGKYNEGGKIPNSLIPLSIEAKKYPTAESFELALQKVVKSGEGNMIDGKKFGDTEYNYSIAIELDKEGYKNVRDFWRDANKGEYNECGQIKDTYLSEAFVELKKKHPSSYRIAKNYFEMRLERGVEEYYNSIGKEILESNKSPEKIIKIFEKYNRIALANKRKYDDGGRIKGTIFRGDEFIKYYERENGNLKLDFYKLEKIKGGKTPKVCEGFSDCKFLDTNNVIPDDFYNYIKQGKFMHEGGRTSDPLGIIYGNMSPEEAWQKLTEIDKYAFFVDEFGMSGNATKMWHSISERKWEDVPQGCKTEFKHWLKEKQKKHLDNGGKIPESILTQETDLNYTREQKYKGLDNISNSEENSVEKTIKEFIGGLTNEKQIKAGTNYFATGKIINGKDIVIRVSNHFLDTKNIGKDEYVISIEISNDLQHKRGYLGYQLMVTEADNYTNIEIPNNKKYIDDYIDELLYHISNVEVPKDILELAEKEKGQKMSIGGKIPYNYDFRIKYGFYYANNNFIIFVFNENENHNKNYTDAINFKIVFEDISRHNKEWAKQFNEAYIEGLFVRFNEDDISKLLEKNNELPVFIYNQNYVVLSGVIVKNLNQEKINLASDGAKINSMELKEKKIGDWKAIDINAPVQDGWREMAVTGLPSGWKIIEKISTKDDNEIAHHGAKINTMEKLDEYGLYTDINTFQLWSPDIMLTAQLSREDAIKGLESGNYFLISGQAVGIKEKSANDGAKINTMEIDTSEQISHLLDNFSYKSTPTNFVNDLINFLTSKDISFANDTKNQILSFDLSELGAKNQRFVNYWFSRTASDGAKINTTPINQEKLYYLKLGNIIEEPLYRNYIKIVGYSKEGVLTEEISDIKSKPKNTFTTFYSDIIKLMSDKKFIFKWGDTNTEIPYENDRDKNLLQIEINSIIHAYEKDESAMRESDIRSEVERTKSEFEHYKGGVADTIGAMEVMQGGGGVNEGWSKKNGLIIFYDCNLFLTKLYVEYPKLEMKRGDKYKLLFFDRKDEVASWELGKDYGSIKDTDTAAKGTRIDPTQWHFTLLAKFGEMPKGVDLRFTANDSPYLLVYSKDEDAIKYSEKVKEKYPEISIRKYKEGGRIENQYEGKLAGDVWDIWTKKQRKHFLKDHFSDPVQSEMYNDVKYIDLPLFMQKIVREHISEGQYAGGGRMEIKYVKGTDIPELWWNKAYDSKKDIDPQLSDEVIYEKIKDLWNKLSEKEKEQIKEEIKSPYYRKFYKNPYAGGGRIHEAIKLGVKIKNLEKKHNKITPEGIKLKKYMDEIWTKMNDYQREIASSEIRKISSIQPEEAQENYYYEGQYAGGGRADKVEWYGINYNIVYEKPDSDLAWKEVVNAQSEKEAREKFAQKHPTCNILSIGEQYDGGGRMATGGRFIVEYGGKHNMKSVWNVRDTETKGLKTSFRDKVGAKLYATELNKNPNLSDREVMDIILKYSSGGSMATGGGIRKSKVEEVKNLLKENKIDSDYASPNFVNDFAWEHGIKDLTSEEVVQISDTYESDGGTMAARGRMVGEQEFVVRYVSKDRMKMRKSMRGETKTWVCGKSREDVLKQVKGFEDFGELISIKPTGNFGELNQCETENEGIVIEEEGIMASGGKILPEKLHGKMFGVPFEVLKQFDIEGNVAMEIYDTSKEGGLMISISGDKKKVKSEIDKLIYEIVKRSPLFEGLSKVGIDALIKGELTETEGHKTLKNVRVDSKKFVKNLSNIAREYNALPPIEKREEKEIGQKTSKEIKELKPLKRHKKSNRNLALDKMLKALHPSKRISATGKVYYEYRPNRSDVNRTIRLQKGGRVRISNSDIQIGNRFGMPNGSIIEIKNRFIDKTYTDADVIIVYTRSDDKEYEEHENTQDTLRIFLNNWKAQLINKHTEEILGEKYWVKYGSMANGGKLEVANEIKRQLGHKALFMLGAKDIAGDEKSLSFKIRGSKKWKHIKIFLNGKDLYDVTFSTWRGDKITKKTINDVYVDNLHSVIREETGLYTSLAKGGQIKKITLKDKFYHARILSPKGVKVCKVPEWGIILSESVANKYNTDAKITTCVYPDGKYHVQKVMVKKGKGITKKIAREISEQIVTKINK